MIGLYVLLDAACVLATCVAHAPLLPCRCHQRLAKFVDNMKADIRTLHNDICERILGKFVGGLTSPRAKAAPAGDAAASTPWQERTLELEEQLSKFVIGSTAEFGPQKLVEVRRVWVTCSCCLFTCGRMGRNS